VADSDDGDFSEQAAMRLVLRALAALVAFLLAAAMAVALTRGDEGASDDGGLVSASEALVGTASGPLPGTDVATYVEGRERALREATGRWVAVVSLRQYLNGAAAIEVSRNVSGLLVAAQGGEPDVLDDSLATWATTQRREAEEERTQLQSMVSTTEEQEFRAQFEADIKRLDGLLANLDPAKPVVFGLIVTGSAAELRTLAAHPEVRLVDIVGRRRPPLDRLHGLRPEETVRAADPRTRPL
jgi:hypothetical protein